MAPGASTMEEGSEMKVWATPTATATKHLRSLRKLQGASRRPRVNFPSSEQRSSKRPRKLGQPTGLLGKTGTPQPVLDRNLSGSCQTHLDPQVEQQKHQQPPAEGRLEKAVQRKVCGRSGNGTKQAASIEAIVQVELHVVGPSTERTHERHTNQ